MREKIDDIVSPIGIAKTTIARAEVLLAKLNLEYDKEDMIKALAYQIELSICGIFRNYIEDLMKRHKFYDSEYQDFVKYLQVRGTHVISTYGDGSALLRPEQREFRKHKRQAEQVIREVSNNKEK